MTDKPLLCIFEDKAGLINPTLRFDRTFLNGKKGKSMILNLRLNPRFDGAFLIHYEADNVLIEGNVLIPDLMGLF